ncbi:Sigma-70 family RNA polymerase sigma factor [Sulfidibacter corallicola]|uniref:Sigma-70 family RNA polymerase sigma factor n=1 Tax=Sulfidibacter corallicola TaxID=2818388 RepID=A0A8A4TNP3_SULCO|nr:ECF-type sigma factor [Sulfidibacter corallicola]QTD50824.1 sigma-70 family RNA polymerase sigma factor [Sulfidibacter corallicola]
MQLDGSIDVTHDELGNAAGREQSPITGLLLRWNEGDVEAINDLLPLVYRDLHQAARYYLRNEAAAMTLQPTALLHEVYVNLVHRENFFFKDRTHFFRAACQLMRRILVDHARAKLAQKRGSGSAAVSLEDAMNQGWTPSVDPCTMLSLNQALDKLEQIDPRKAQVIQMRYYTGLQFGEIAQVLEVSHRTVKRDFETAKKWLAHELRQNRSSEEDDSLSGSESEDAYERGG